MEAKPYSNLRPPAESQGCYQGFVLASQSPRRLELLRQLYPSANITVIISDTNEDRFYELAAADRCKQLAILKANTVLETQADQCRQRIVIGADTEVVIDGQSLGKPADNREAIDMLSKLSGRRHEVISAFALIDGDDKKVVSEAVSTSVLFKALSITEIKRYVSKGESLDKAGAYGIQGRGVSLVERIEGSFSNVVGLPLENLFDTLGSQFDWQP